MIRQRLLTGLKMGTKGLKHVFFKTFLNTQPVVSAGGGGCRPHASPGGRVAVPGLAALRYSQLGERIRYVLRPLLSYARRLEARLSDGGSLPSLHGRMAGGPSVILGLRRLSLSHKL